MNMFHTRCCGIVVGLKVAALSTLTLTLLSIAHADFPKPGDWKPLVSNPTPNYVKGLVYGDGIWVAVGDFGYIATSVNGIAWTQQESSAPKDWSADQVTGFEIVSVAYGEGRWVACGSDGMVYTSENGTSWTSKVVDAAANNYLEEVIYANRQWTITGSYGGVITSSDGINWQKRPITGAGAIWALGYGDGKWVSIDWFGKIFASQNGTDWSVGGTFPVGDNDWPEDIHFANGLWVCANNFGQIFTSANLANWTLRYDAPLSWILTSIDYQNGQWVVVGGVNGEGNTGNYEGGNIVTSTDGINWTDQVQIEKSTFVWEVAYGGGQWIGATSGYGGFFRSIDGLNWSYNAAFVDDALPEVQNEAEYQNGMWIVPLQDGTIMQSVDGQSWTTSILDHGPAGYQSDWLNPAHYSSRLNKWFVGGDFGKLYSSSDGYDWSAQTYPGKGIEDIAEGNGKLINVGRLWDVFSSVDGINWTNVSHPLSGVTTGRFTGIEYANGTWVAVGEMGNIIYSSDGVSWTKSTVSGGQNLHSITYADGLWVTAGVSGAIYWSSNLTTWTKSNLPGELAYPNEHTLTKVKKIDNTWVALGGTRWADTKIYTSTDGKIWTAYPNILFPSGTIRDITKVGDTWHLFGYTLRGATFIMSTAAPQPVNREVVFSDAGRYTVTDTADPAQFKRLPLSKTIGDHGETVYVSFTIERASPLRVLDFTGLQLSRSATNQPKAGDLGLGNSGPSTNYGGFVEGSSTFGTAISVPLDMTQHIIMARIDYSNGTVAMVVDPQSAVDIESATRHSVPTNPASTIMLRAGHFNTSYTYSRIALGEDPSKVLSFTRNESSNLPEITVVRNADGTVTLSWPQSDEAFALQSARDLTGFADVSGVQEADGKFNYTTSIALIKSNYYRLRQIP